MILMDCTRPCLFFWPFSEARYSRVCLCHSGESHRVASSMISTSNPSSSASRIFPFTQTSVTSQPILSTCILFFKSTSLSVFAHGATSYPSFGFPISCVTPISKPEYASRFLIHHLYIFTQSVGSMIPSISSISFHLTLWSGHRRSDESSGLRGFWENSGSHHLDAKEIWFSGWRSTVSIIKSPLSLASWVTRFTPGTISIPASTGSHPLGVNAPCASTRSTAVFIYNNC